VAKLTRRESLAMTLGMIAATGISAAKTPAKSTGGLSLNALALAKGMRFGSAVSDGAGGSFDNANYARLLQADCGLVVPERELKWQALRPRGDQFDFAAFDRIMAAAQAHGMAVRGHTLLWQKSRWMPSWVESHDFGANPAAEAERLLRAHITTVCARYLGRIRSYDVVNEAVVHEDGTLAETALSRAMGGAEALLDLAFRIAREAAPNAQLVYNDYMSWEPGNEAHREGVRKLLAGFRRRNVPVDALGVQSHLVPRDPPQEKAWRQFINEVTAMHFDILITEFDVNDQWLARDIAVRDRAVADYARAHLDLMFSYPQLKDMLVWGMCDKASWLQYFPPFRSDGQPKRPCPYDSDYRPKQLRGAIAAAFSSAAVRG
jgi:endo-1,4-beta-xylanase